ncbi:bifunctional SET domain superfamily/SET domain/Post-SET domain/FY-rich [Babesia duncani]|uniref:[histone H3]-lysine(4) N-trimethyltransferase n=1 Tax=Babesia duncani TaxID=323732 RepID=A0AAD9UP44_9APIC|nr:bifunctional SET domain superfamily/SET domain/Post-SET domain/FY-rich [Babesia duncani]
MENKIEKKGNEPELDLVLFNTKERVCPDSMINEKKNGNGATYGTSLYDNSGSREASDSTHVDSSFDKESTVDSPSVYRSGRPQDNMLKRDCRFILYASTRKGVPVGLDEIRKATNKSMRIASKFVIFNDVNAINNVSDYGVVSFSKIRNTMEKVKQDSSNQTFFDIFINSTISDNDYKLDFRQLFEIETSRIGCCVFEDIALCRIDDQICLCLLINTITADSYGFDMKRSRSPQNQLEAFYNFVSNLSCNLISGHGDATMKRWCIAFPINDHAVEPTLVYINVIDIFEFNPNIVEYDRKDFVEVMRNVLVRNLRLCKPKELNKYPIVLKSNDISLKICCKRHTITATRAVSFTNTMCWTCSITLLLFNGEYKHELDQKEIAKMTAKNHHVHVNILSPLGIVKKRTSETKPKPITDEKPNTAVEKPKAIIEKPKSQTANSAEKRTKPSSQPEKRSKKDVPNHVHKPEIMKELIKEEPAVKKFKAPPLVNDVKTEVVLVLPQKESPVPSCKFKSSFTEINKSKSVEKPKVAIVPVKKIIPVNLQRIEIVDELHGFKYVGCVIKHTPADKEPIEKVGRKWKYAIVKYWEPKCRAFFIHGIKPELWDKTDDCELMNKLLEVDKTELFDNNILWIATNTTFVLLLSDEKIYTRGGYRLCRKVLHTNNVTCQRCDKPILCFNTNGRYQGAIDEEIPAGKLSKVVSTFMNQPNSLFQSPLHTTIAAIREIEKERNSIYNLLDSNLDIVKLVIKDFQLEYLTSYTRHKIAQCLNLIYWIRNRCGITMEITSETLIPVVYWGLECAICGKAYHAKCLPYIHMRQFQCDTSIESIKERYGHFKRACRSYRNQENLLNVMNKSYNSDSSDDDIDSLIIDDDDEAKGGNDNIYGTDVTQKMQKDNNEAISSNIRKNGVLFLPLHDDTRSSQQWNCESCIPCLYCELPIGPVHQYNRREIPNGIKTDGLHIQCFDDKLDRLQRNCLETEKVKSVCCVSCNAGAHRACCNPYVPNLVFIESWKCDWCSRCISCGHMDSVRSDYTNWGLFFLFCLRCWASFEKGNYCGVCYKIWTNYDTTTQRWIQCDGCKLWVHVECDNVAKNLTECNAIRYQNYRCKICCCPNKLNRCWRLLELVFLVDKVNQFRYPVSASCVVYWRLVTKPMDLTTLRKKLENCKYKNIAEFIFDILLIPYNAKMVNMPNTKIYKLSVIFERKCREHITEIMQIGRQEIDTILDNGIKGACTVHRNPQVPSNPTTSSIDDGKNSSDQSTHDLSLEIKGNGGVLIESDSIDASRSASCRERERPPRKIVQDFNLVENVLCPALIHMPASDLLPKPFVPCGMNFSMVSIWPWYGIDEPIQIQCCFSPQDKDLHALTKSGQVILLDAPNGLYVSDEKFAKTISALNIGDICTICGSDSYSHAMIHCSRCFDMVHYFCAGFPIMPNTFKCVACLPCTRCNHKVQSNHPYDVANVQDINLANSFGWIPSSVTVDLMDLLQFKPNMYDDTVPINHEIDPNDLRWPIFSTHCAGCSSHGHLKCLWTRRTPKKQIQIPSPVPAPALQSSIVEPVGSNAMKNSLAHVPQHINNFQTQVMQLQTSKQSLSWMNRQPAPIVKFNTTPMYLNQDFYRGTLLPPPYRYVPGNSMNYTNTGMNQQQGTHQPQLNNLYNGTRRIRQLPINKVNPKLVAVFLQRIKIHMNKADQDSIAFNSANTQLLKTHNANSEQYIGSVGRRLLKCTRLVKRITALINSAPAFQAPEELNDNALKVIHGKQETSFSKRQGFDWAFSNGIFTCTANCKNFYDNTRMKMMPHHLLFVSNNCGEADLLVHTLKNWCDLKDNYSRNYEDVILDVASVGNVNCIIPCMLCGRGIETRSHDKPRVTYLLLCAQPAYELCDACKKWRSCYSSYLLLYSSALGKRMEMSKLQTFANDTLNTISLACNWVLLSANLIRYICCILSSVLPQDLTPDLKKVIIGHFIKSKAFQSIHPLILSAMVDSPLSPMIFSYWSKRISNSGYYLNENSEINDNNEDYNRQVFKRRRERIRNHLIIKLHTDYVASSCNYYWTYRDLLSFKICYDELESYLVKHRKQPFGPQRRHLCKMWKTFLPYFIRDVFQITTRSSRRRPYPYFRRHLAKLIFSSGRYNLPDAEPYERTSAGSICGTTALRDVNSVLRESSRPSPTTASPAFVLSILSKESGAFSFLLRHFYKHCKIQQANKNPLFKFNVALYPRNISEEIVVENESSSSTSWNITRYLENLKRHLKQTNISDMDVGARTLFAKFLGRSLLAETASIRAIIGDAVVGVPSSSCAGCSYSITNYDNLMESVDEKIDTRLVYYNAEPDLIRGYRTCCLCKINQHTLLRGSLIPFRNGFVHSNCILWSVASRYLPRSYNVNYINLYKGKYSKNLNTNLLNCTLLPVVYLSDLLVEDVLSNVEKCAWCNCDGASVPCSGNKCNLKFHLTCSFIATTLDTYPGEAQPLPWLPLFMCFSGRRIWCRECFAGPKVDDSIISSDWHSFLALEGLSSNASVSLSLLSEQSVRIMPLFVFYEDLDSYLMNQCRIYKKIKLMFDDCIKSQPQGKRICQFLESVLKPKYATAAQGYYLYGGNGTRKSQFAHLHHSSQKQSETRGFFRIGSIAILNLGTGIAVTTKGRLYPIGYLSIRRFVGANIGCRASYACSIVLKDSAPWFIIDLLGTTPCRLSEGPDLHLVFDMFLKKIKFNGSYRYLSAESFFGINLHVVIQEMRFGFVKSTMSRCIQYCKFASFTNAVNGKRVDTTGFNLTKTMMLGGVAKTLPFNIKASIFGELVTTTLDFDAESGVIDYTDARANRSRNRKQCDTNNQAMQYRYLLGLPPERRLVVSNSAIHGLGLFATEDIPAGEPVIEYVGELIRDVIGDMREEYYSKEQGGDGSCYMFRLDEQLIVDATRRGTMSRFINHSCDPNCICRIITCENGLKHIVIFTKTDVKAGIEITYDYQFGVESDTKKIACLCGAANCLGRMN